ncbi:lytic transglycosylase domain-containing protein [Kaistia dalseonensis]|uniref:Transglycosylase SLT domain-containing protein n=1 Tax=Kaistia dalseonensis TaxID=410840 RepID=A0ABU0HAU0_9HYPH|nr:lytic transglycosylase domain-containing protein [Kaistia dalseonensis]MCX5496800.1 lytic transglycosylase domain-containing protein [Kaistia dalseonensis]MDQ0439426.1 hypothetical protein [Kaistia dalseonensis]
MTARLLFAILGLLALPFSALSASAADEERRPAETLEQTVCRLIEAAALANALPADYFTRLIWRESSFRPHVTSGAGAQGIAQFMPGTATDRGLTDPFDPEEAIPASAAYLKALEERFGNLGLAAAAYNAGPTRVANWIGKGGFLPIETEDYVAFITGRSVYDWLSPDGLKNEKATTPPASCTMTVAAIRKFSPSLYEGPYARYGVQLAGNFSKSRAIASYERVVRRYPAILEGKPTLIIGTRMAGRGRRAFYRVRLPAETIRQATELCNRLQKAGGSCVVLRN